MVVKAHDRYILDDLCHGDVFLSLTAAVLVVIPIIPARASCMTTQALAILSSAMQ
jgi:hypothetical protein